MRGTPCSCCITLTRACVVILVLLHTADTLHSSQRTATAGRRTCHSAISIPFDVVYPIDVVPLARSMRIPAPRCVPIRVRTCSCGGVLILRRAASHSSRLCRRIRPPTTHVCPYPPLDHSPLLALPSLSVSTAPVLSLPSPPLLLAHPTPTGYNKALPHLLPILHAAHSARLSRRRTTLQKAVLTAAQTARAAAPPGAWAYWLPGYTLQAWAPLRALVDDELAREEAEELARSGADAEHVPGLVEAWRAERKRQLGGACGDADVGGAGGADARAAGADDVLHLDLATSVFTCLGSWVPGTRVHAGRCLIGWAGAGAHLRCGSLQSFWENRLHHEPEGARAVAVLVWLAGRDPASTSAAEMDKVDVWYVCGGCAVQVRGGVRGRKALTWREGVLHAVEAARGAEPGHAEGAEWAVLSRGRRGGAHCEAHFDKHVLREEAPAHVREAHAIPRSVQDAHFMFFPGAERTPRVAALLSEEGLVAEYRCAHCTDVLPRAVRLFSMRALERHVCDKCVHFHSSLFPRISAFLSVVLRLAMRSSHGRDVVREADWMRVEQIAGSSAMEPVSRSGAVGPTPTPLDALPE
ncbi:hypothetical protein C8J57DRAFT_1713512 [Mycena rebaudengoi]|nr:hypothetical protein C8J57DRAFT_1713512 [Mycena rebaudengoi]